MWGKLLDSVIPGFREARAPAFAGLGWAVVIWLLAASSFPDRSDAKGLAAEVYRSADALGAGWSLAMVGVAIAAIGLVAAPLTDAFASWSGGCASAFRYWIDSRRTAAVKRTALVKSLRKAEEKLDQIEGDDDKAIKARSQAQANVDKLRSQVDSVFTATIFRVHRLTPSVRAVLGIRRESVLTEECHSLVGRAAFGAASKWLATDARIEDTDGFSSRDVVFLDGFSQSCAELERKVREFPFDVLKQHSPEMFLEIDRERAETELQIALTLPLMVAGLVLVVRYGLGQGWIVAVLSAVAFARASVLRTAEPVRVARSVAVGSNPPQEIEGMMSEAQATLALRAATKRREAGDKKTSGNN